MPISTVSSRNGAVQRLTAHASVPSNAPIVSMVRQARVHLESAAMVPAEADEIRCAQSPKQSETKSLSVAYAAR
jgi:hypothetical protein